MEETSSVHHHYSVVPDLEQTSILSKSYAPAAGSLRALTNVGFFHLILEHCVNLLFGSLVVDSCVYEQLL